MHLLYYAIIVLFICILQADVVHVKVLTNTQKMMGNELIIILYDTYNISFTHGRNETCNDKYLDISWHAFYSTQFETVHKNIAQKM